MVIDEELAINVPEFTKFPPKDKLNVLVFKVAPLFIVKGAFNTLFPPRVTSFPLVLAMITPPEPLKVLGNSTPVVCAPVPLYRNVAEPPKFGDEPVVVAVPSIERIPLKVAPVVVFAPEPESVAV